MAGASSYFYGRYAGSGDSWSGVEEWILLSNDTWESAGGGDCVVQWAATAERTDDTGSCAACTYGLDVVASINASATTCPEGLYEGEENFTVSYAVMVSGDAATFYYAGSGNPVGSGNSTDGSASFLTEGVCAWF